MFTAPRCRDRGVLQGLGLRACSPTAVRSLQWSQYPGCGFLRCPNGEHIMTFRTYIVEDSPTIRENLIETLQELTDIEPVGTAETDHEGKRWLAQNDDDWDLAIVDLFLREGSG